MKSITYKVIDMTGEVHTVIADATMYEEGRAVFYSTQDGLQVVAIFNNPTSIVKVTD